MTLSLTSETPFCKFTYEAFTIVVIYTIFPFLLLLRVYIFYKLTFKGDGFCVQVNSDWMDWYQCCCRAPCNIITLGECLAFLSLNVNVTQVHSGVEPKVRHLHLCLMRMGKH